MFKLSRKLEFATPLPNFLQIVRVRVSYDSWTVVNVALKLVIKLGYVSYAQM